MRPLTLMFFLIRTAFWFSLVLLFLPIWPGAQDTDNQPVGAIEAISAAQQAVSDISGICERRPGVCETGKRAAQTIGARAQESARAAYMMLEQQQGGDEAAPVVDTQGFAVTPDTAMLPSPRPDF